MGVSHNNRGYERNIHSNNIDEKETWKTIMGIFILAIVEIIIGTLKEVYSNIGHKAA